MKRIALFALVALLSLAQRSRDDYRTAYKQWRQTDPNLEREAASGGAPVAQRADRMAGEAAKAAAARKAYLEGLAQEEQQLVSDLENTALNPPAQELSTVGDARFVSAEIATVTRTMDTFANDPDRGIQQLRQALARERAALEALNPMIAQRKKAADAVNTSSVAVVQASAKAVEQSRAILDAFKDAAADSDREAAAWAEYYRKLGEAAQGQATPITESQPGAAPAVLNNPIPAPPTITPLPLARYVGAWTFPASNGLFHGPQPESFDIMVRDENGKVTGTGSARFKLPPGSSADPVLRFDFSGTFQASQRQVFNVVTAEGAKGTIELIPGPAFNLLEVNFQTEAKPGKIRQADAMLVKK